MRPTDDFTTDSAFDERRFAGHPATLAHALVPAADGEDIDESLWLALTAWN